MATGIDDNHGVDGPHSDAPADRPPVREGERAPEDAAAPVDAPVPPSGSVWTASDARGPLEKADDIRAPSAEEAVVPSPSPSPAADPASPSEPADHAAPSFVPPVDQTSRRSSWPIAAGIVVGAMIGAGGALLAVSQGLVGGQGDAQVAALSSKVDALEKRPDVSAEVATLNGRVAALSGKLDGLAKGVEGAAPAPPAAASGDVEALQRSVATLQASVAALTSRNEQAAGADHGTDEKVAALSSELAGLKSTASQTEASLAGVKDDQKRLSDKVTVPALAVAADSLVRQVDQGEPFATQLDALASLGADPAKLAVLRQNADRGVPSSKTLAQTFEPLAEPIGATARKVPADAGFVDRLKSGMLNLVSIRGVDDTSGADLPSRVARIKLDLAHDDVADAVATWDMLPPDAKAKSEAWATLARSSAAAMVAARALQRDAIAALGTKKS